MDEGRTSTNASDNKKTNDNVNWPYIREMAWADYMCQKKEEEEDLLA